VGSGLSWRGAAVGRIRAGPGRPVVLGDDVVEAIVHDTLHTVPEDGSACWSTERRDACADGFGSHWFNWVHHAQFEFAQRCLPPVIG
jgi:hypothetical protein